MRIGVDLGGVVIETGGPDTMFNDDYLQTPAVPLAIEAIALLGQEHELYVVSKCGPKVEAKSRHWLAEHRFADLTGVVPERWHFVRERADKGPLARRLGLHAFIDDRTDVLAAMPPGVTPLLFGSHVHPDWLAVLRRLGAMR